jgi:hypothetical protein
MALGSTQPLTEISTRGEGKGGRCVGLQLYQLHVPIVMKSGSLKADSHIECRAHAVPLPSRAAKCLECVFPI